MIKRVDQTCASNGDLVRVLLIEPVELFDHHTGRLERDPRYLRRTLVDRRTGEILDDAWRDSTGATRSYSAIRTAVVCVALIAAMFAAAARAASANSWRWSTTSAYSTSDSPGTQACNGRRLRDDTRTFASLIVPCGARVQFCAGRRCVVATRTDSGPYVAGRSFDLALGTVRALGFGSAREFGVRTLRWRRA